MSKKEAALQKDVPWRASSAAKPIPKIHRSPVLRVPQNPYSDYALSVMKHDNPIGRGLGKEAVVEAAGPDCIVPGQAVPIKLLGLKAVMRLNMECGYIPRERGKLRYSASCKGMANRNGLDVYRTSWA